MSIQSMISSIFGSAPAPTAPVNQPNTQQAQPTPGNIPPNTGVPANPLPNTAPNGTVPEQNASATPLDDFKDLWKNEPTDPNAPPVDKSVFGKVDGDELMKAASAIDFTKVVTPDMLAAINAGGEAGTRALLEALNKTQQLGYAQSAHATTKLIEQAIAKTRQEFVAELPKLIRDKNASDLIKETPAYAHPAAQPLIDAMTAQLQVKYPNATPTELRDLANRYITGFADSVKPAPKQVSSDEGGDWEAFLNS